MDGDLTCCLTVRPPFYEFSAIVGGCERLFLVLDATRRVDGSADGFRVRLEVFRRVASRLAVWRTVVAVCCSATCGVRNDWMWMRRGVRGVLHNLTHGDPTQPNTTRVPPPTVPTRHSALHRVREKELHVRALFDPSIAATSHESHGVRRRGVRMQKNSWPLHSRVPRCKWIGGTTLVSAGTPFTFSRECHHCQSFT